MELKVFNDYGDGWYDFIEVAIDNYDIPAFNILEDNKEEREKFFNQIETQLNFYKTRERIESITFSDRVFIGKTTLTR